MSRKSKKGFRKLEDHEMAEFTKLNGEESGSDSEIIELARERNSRWGGVCCWCVALYLLLVTCFLVLMAMVAVYFGYNMVRMSGDYNQRLDNLEDKIGQLSSQLSSSNEDYTAKMKEMKQMVAQVNHSLLSGQQSADKQHHDTQQRLTTAEKNLEQVQGKMANFESHPPTIGEEEIQKMRSSMAAFKSTIESYDSQFVDIKRTVGDARHEVTQTNDRVELLRRNVSRLRSNFSGLHLFHQDTSNSLDLVSTQISALQTVVHGINETLNQAVALSSEEFNETQSGLEDVQQKLSSITQVLSDITSDIDELNVTMTQAASVKDESTAQATPSATNPPAGPTLEPSEATTESTSPPTEPTTDASDSASQSTEPTSKPVEPSNPPTKLATNTTRATNPVTEPTPSSTNKPTSETTRPTTQSTPPATEPASEPTDSTTKPTNSTAERTDPTIERIHSTAGPTVEDTEFDATNEPPKALADASVPALHENQSMNINSSTMFPSGITAQPNSESDDDKTSHEGDSTYGSEIHNSDTPSSIKEDSHTTVPPFDQTTTTETAETNADSTGATEDMPGVAPDSIANNATNETGMEQPTASSATPLTPTQHGTSTLEPPTVDSKSHSKSDILMTLQGILNNFDTLDADFSSSLSMQEFSDFFPDGLSQSVIVLFNNLDMNQDSFIYKSEVRTLIRRIEQNGTKSSVSVPSPGEMNTSTKPSQVSPVMLLQDILRNFVKFDFNLDFALNLKEFSAFLKSSPQNAKVLSIFRKLDFNGDGFLTEQEIRHALSQFPTENPTQDHSKSETAGTSEDDMDS